MLPKVNYSELTETYKKLLQEAQFVAHRAYNLYSGFFVGSCVLTENNKFYRGTFLENISFGVTVCAEVSAILSALSSGDILIKAIAIAGGSNFEEKGIPVTPCGRCRQIISEMSALNNIDITVICSDLQLSSIVITSISELLPSSFQSNGSDTSDKIIEFKKRVLKNSWPI